MKKRDSGETRTRDICSLANLSKMLDRRCTEYRESPQAHVSLVLPHEGGRGSRSSRFQQPKVGIDDKLGRFLHLLALRFRMLEGNHPLGYLCDSDGTEDPHIPPPQTELPARRTNTQPRSHLVGGGG